MSNVVQEKVESERASSCVLDSVDESETRDLLNYFQTVSRSESMHKIVNICRHLLSPKQKQQSEASHGSCSNIVITVTEQSRAE